MYELAILIHVIGATVWTGGHIVLSVAVLPDVLKHKDLNYIRRFESGYEKIGIPALIVQIVSGLYLASFLIPEVSQIFDWANPAVKLLWVKLSLLLITALLAADARLRVIPNLSASNLNSLAFRIIPVMVVSVLFVISGVLYRFGWFA